MTRTPHKPKDEGRPAQPLGTIGKCLTPSDGVLPILQNFWPAKAPGRTPLGLAQVAQRILFRMRSGCQVGGHGGPERFCPHSTVHDWFHSVPGRVMQRLWRELARECANSGRGLALAGRGRTGWGKARSGGKRWENPTARRQRRSKEMRSVCGIGTLVCFSAGPRPRE